MLDISGVLFMETRAETAPCYRRQTIDRRWPVLAMPSLREGGP